MSSTPITMQTHAVNYLSERRHLGFALRTPGYYINSFARYVDDRVPRRRIGGRIPPCSYAA